MRRALIVLGSVVCALASAQASSCQSESPPLVQPQSQTPCEQFYQAYFDAVKALCDTELPDCCACSCWEVAWGAFDLEAWIDSCVCTCDPEGAPATDQPCEGELLEAVEECLADLDACLAPFLEAAAGYCENNAVDDCVPGGDTDVECDPPTGVSDWGGPCDPDADDCPADTRCISFKLLDPEAGYCAPQCCESDHGYCTDIGSGDEQCLINDGISVEWWCVVLCGDDDDCPDGTTCVVINAEYSICYGT